MRTLGQTIGILSVVLAGYLSAPGTARAEPIDDIDGTLDRVRTEGQYGFANGSFVVAPVPFKNSLIGAGLALGGGYLFKLDENSDTSLVGLAAMRSENGSSAYGLGGSLAFLENRWQLRLAGGEAEAFYDLYLGNLPVPVRQSGELYNGTLYYGLNKDVHIGAGLRYLKTNVALDVNAPIVPLPDTDVESAIASLLFKWDTRDDTFSARQGHLLHASAFHGEVLNILKRSYQRGVLSYSGYHPAGPEASFAYSVSACGASKRAPFFEKCSLGGTDAFRGFSPTRYLDSALVSAQAEFRQSFGKRISGVVFGGIGSTGPSFDALGNTNLHAAGGFGFRFQLSRKFKAVFSVDTSINDEQEQLVYVYVGQRF